MQQVLTLVLPFFGLIFIGYMSAKLRKLPIEGLAWLNFLVVYIALPALLFQLLAKTPIEQLANGWFVAATTLATLTAFLISFFVGMRATRGNLSESAIIAVAGGYSNVGYMGPALALAALGTAAAVPTALILCFDNALIFILVPMLMSIAGATHKTFGRAVLEIASRILLHPFILGTIAGILASAFQIHPPEVVDRLLTYLLQSAMPCALFALGVTVALRPIVAIPAELPYAIFIKLIIHPLLVLVLLNLVGGIDPLWIGAAVLIESLPPALSAFILAQQYEVYEDRASTTILIGTAVSVVTVTGVLYLVVHQMMPVMMFGR